LPERFSISISIGSKIFAGTAFRRYYIPDSTVGFRVWIPGRVFSFPGIGNQEMSFPGLDWIEQCFTSPPTLYRLYGRQFLQVKRHNQQYLKVLKEMLQKTNQTMETTKHTYAHTITDTKRIYTK